MNTAKLEKIETLAIQVKNGDKNATEELLKIFNPLIYNISNRIYIRYKQTFPLDEIVRQSRCLLIQLTVSVYTPGGQAYYPYFLKQSLHANLVNIYRPLYDFIHRTTSLDKLQLISPTGIEHIYQDERVEICAQLMAYIDKTFNKREKDIVDLVMYKGMPRDKLARKYHISYTRMKVIYKRVIKKLREQLMKIGIKNVQDI